MRLRREAITMGNEDCGCSTDKNFKLLSPPVRTETLKAAVLYMCNNRKSKEAVFHRFNLYEHQRYYMLKVLANLSMNGVHSIRKHSYIIPKHTCVVKVTVNCSTVGI